MKIDLGKNFGEDLGKTLAGLKQVLQEATDLSRPWDRFHDDVAMVPAYSQTGEVADNPRIAVGLEMAAAHILKRRWKVSDAHFVHLAEHHFWHGSCSLGPRTAIFFFFDDIDVGLAGFFRALTDPRVELARVTVVQLHDADRGQFN